MPYDESEVYYNIGYATCVDFYYTDSNCNCVYSDTLCF